jgi:hypothetical protein
MADKDDEQRWDEAVGRLTEMTERGEIQWKEQRLSLRPMMDAFVGPQFVTEFDSRRIAVYEYSFPAENSDYGRYIDSRVVVEFVDEGGERVWVWPVSSGNRWELLEAVRFQVSQADGFLDALLRRAPSGPATV